MAKKSDPLYRYDWVTPELIDAFELYDIKDPVEQRNLLQAILAENGGKVTPEKYNGPSRYDYFEGMYGVGTAKGKMLGNDKKGDGVKYAGQGLFHLTGKWNYDRMQKLTGVKVKDNPDFMKDPETDQIVSLAYLRDRASRMGIKDFKDPAKLHEVIRPSESWQKRSERVLPISDVDWQLIVDTRANRPQEPAPEPAQRMTLEQFRREQSGGITPNTTPPAR